MKVVVTVQPARVGFDSSTGKDEVNYRIVIMVGHASVAIGNPYKRKDAAERAAIKFSKTKMEFQKGGYR